MKIFRSGIQAEVVLVFIHKFGVPIPHRVPLASGKKHLVRPLVDDLPNLINPLHDPYFLSYLGLFVPAPLYYHKPA
jgi:hypothetical protein